MLDWSPLEIVGDHVRFTLTAPEGASDLAHYYLVHEIVNPRGEPGDRRPPALPSRWGFASI
jgi:hypothetical protein